MTQNLELKNKGLTSLSDSEMMLIDGGVTWWAAIIGAVAGAIVGGVITALTFGEGVGFGAVVGAAIGVWVAEQF